MPRRTTSLRATSRRVTLAALVAGALTGIALADTSSERLERAIYTEESVGDLEAAIGLYNGLVRDPQTSRAVAAEAQLRLGLCHLQLGDRPASERALRELAERYPERHELIALARQQLPATATEDSLTLARGVEPHAAFDAINRRFAAAFADRDTATLAELYTDDAVVLDPDADIERGVAGRGERLRQLFDLLELRRIAPRMTVTIVKRELLGDVAFDVGYFSVILPISGEEHALRGKFLSLYRRSSAGEWRIHVDASSTLPSRLSDWESFGALIGVILEDS